MGTGEVNGTCSEFREFTRWLIETTALVVAALAIAMTFRATVAIAYEIPTPSMEPTIMVHDRILAERLTPRFGDIAAGDVVVVTDPTGGPIPFVKRVIATSGQTVDINSGAVWVDGERLAEPYTHDLPTEPMSVSLPVTVPPGHIWVMGDNRTNSSDSRVFGPVPVASVRAVAICVYWPPEDIDDLDWGD